jgi:hypothetical protein
MTSARKFLVATLSSLILGGALGLAGPSPAAAQKLPVDCSGRRSDCTTVRVCSEWHDHVCWEYTSSFWYWYT